MPYRSVRSYPRPLLTSLCASLALLLPLLPLLPLASCSNRATEGKPTRDGGDAAVQVHRDGSAPVDAGKPTACGKPRPVFAGTLCGTTALPCQVQVREVVEENDKLRAGVSLELDAAGAPMAVFPTNEPDQPLYFVRRSGANQWSRERVLDGVISAALARRGSEPYLYARVDYDHRHLLYHRTNAGWRVLADLAGQGSGGWPGGMIVDQAGCVHLRGQLPKTTPNGDGQATYGVYRPAGGWSFSGPLSYGYDAGPMTLAPNGTPHLTYWGKLDAQSKSLIWATAPGLPEVVVPATNLISLSRLAIAVTPSAGAPLGTPHIFYQRGFGNTANELVLASRESGGQWTRRAIINTLEPDPCATMPPTAPDQTCVSNYLVYEVLALLSGADLQGLRLLYGENHQVIRWVAACPGQGACSWQSASSEITGALHIATINGAQVEHTKAVDGIIPTGAAAKVDDQGRIHLIVAGAPDHPTSLSSVLYYLRLGATK